MLLNPAEVSLERNRLGDCPGGLPNPNRWGQSSWETVTCVLHLLSSCHSQIPGKKDQMNGPRPPLSGREASASVCMQLVRRAHERGQGLGTGGKPRGCRQGRWMPRTKEALRLHTETTMEHSGNSTGYGGERGGHRPCSLSSAKCAKYLCAPLQISVRAGGGGGRC